MTLLVLIYLGYLILLGLLGGAGIYHALKFGFPGDRTRLGVIMYGSAMLIIIISSFIVLGTIDTEAI